MKFSFVVSLVAFVILFVAVTVLYGALAGLGVFDSLQRVVSDVTSSQGSAGVNAKAWFSASRVLGYTALLGSLNIVLITAMSTIGFPAERVPEMDAKMTFAYLRYAADLLGWDENPKAIYVDWIASPRKEDSAERLAAAVDTGAVRDSLEGLAPTHQQYKGLQAALALEKEQPTGHADQIRMNMERWRWAPHDLGERYVLVNVPAYQMQVMDGGKPGLAMRVIVGKPDAPTPLFSDNMTYLVFSPYWNIPPDILRTEALPHLAKDPDWLKP